MHASSWPLVNLYPDFVAFPNFKAVELVDGVFCSALVRKGVPSVFFQRNDCSVDEMSVGTQANPGCGRHERKREEESTHTEPILRAPVGNLDDVV